MVVLVDCSEKFKIFKNLRNLKSSDELYRRLSVSQDYSIRSRKYIKAMIENAKKKDGAEAENFIYTLREPVGLFKIKKK